MGYIGPSKMLWPILLLDFLFTFGGFVSFSLNATNVSFKAISIVWPHYTSKPFVRYYKPAIIYQWLYKHKRNEYFRKCAYFITTERSNGCAGRPSGGGGICTV